MSKNNIIPFPKNKSFNDNFKDNKGNQYFLVDQPRKIKYLLPQDIEKQEIEEDNNIFLPINCDTEFNNYGNSAPKLGRDCLVLSGSLLFLLTSLFSLCLSATATTTASFRTLRNFDTSKCPN